MHSTTIALLLLITSIRPSIADYQHSIDIHSTMEPPRPILLLPPASFFHGLDFVASSSKTAQRFIVGGKPVLLFPDPSSESIGSDATIDGGGSGGASEFADDEHAAKTGTSLWDCSIVLAKFIEDMTLNGDDDERQIFSVKDKRVIELVSLTVPR